MQITTFMDFCSGIGGGRLGLENAGLKCVAYSDTAKLAPITYNLMFDAEQEKNYGNLKKINTDALPDFDMLIAGFPCQSFSVIGRKDGFSDDRGQIIFHISRILKEKQPICFLLENVKGLVTHDKGRTLKTILNELNSAGYNVIYKVLTSLDYGVPQMRQRVYFIGFRKDIIAPLSEFKWPCAKAIPPLADYLIDNHLVNSERLEIMQYYLNNPTNKGKYNLNDLLKQEGKILDTRMNDLRIYDGKCPTLRAQRDGILYVKNGNLHQLTGYEALLLQGFPKIYADKVKNVVSDRHLLMQAGNAMTVPVISELGNSINNFLRYCTIKGGISMNNLNPGEAFETKCYEYLKAFFATKNINFERKGGMDSTTSDIAVIKNNQIDFYIEAKDSPAHSGQFVLLPDESEKTFVFSQKNRSKPNKLANIMIEYMNQNFDRFNKAGTSGESLELDDNVFAGWIVEHYKDRNVKYFISYAKEYVILPIRKFAAYFDIIAKYRIKKSGSGNPAKRDIDAIKNAILKLYPSASFSSEGEKFFVSLSEPLSQNKFTLGKYDYFFSTKNQPPHRYRITRLSNTYNMNVIFSIKLKKSQDPDDLGEFKSDL